MPSPTVAKKGQQALGVHIISNVSKIILAIDEALPAVAIDEVNSQMDTKLTDDLRWYRSQILSMVPSTPSPSLPSDFAAYRSIMEQQQQASLVETNVRVDKTPPPTTKYGFSKLVSSLDFIVTPYLAESTALGFKEAVSAIESSLPKAIPFCENSEEDRCIAVVGNHRRCKMEVVDGNLCGLVSAARPN